MKTLSNISNTAQDTSTHPAAPDPAKLTYAGLGIAASLFFYFHLFHFPATPLWRSWDQTIFMTHAVRMLHGEVIYRDLFQINLPGTEYLYYFLFRLFGVSLWIAPVAMLVNGVSITLLIYSLSRKLLQGSAACVPPVLYLAICQRTTFDGTHHWYSTMLVLLAVRLTISGRLPLLGIAGAVLGVASLFTTTRGLSVALAIAIFLIWKAHSLARTAKPLLVLLAPCFGVIVAAVACLTKLCGPRVLFDAVVVFPARYYSAGYANSFSVYFDEFHKLAPLRAASIFSLIAWIAINLGVPVILAVFCAFLLRTRTHNRELLVLFWLAGMFTFLPVISAPATLRLICAAAFAFILATVLIDRTSLRKFLSCALVGGSVFVLLQIITMLRTPVHILKGPYGAAAIYQRNTYEQFAWIAQNSHPGQTLFGNVDANFFFDLKNPARVPWVEPDEYTRPEDVIQLVTALDRQRTAIICWPESAWKYQGTGDHLNPLRSYLRLHYHQARRFDDGTQALVRNAAD
jgi:hypothetical protein